MTPEDYKQQQDLFNAATLGNQDAVAFLNLFFDICSIWDDLIDKDKNLSDWDINKAFYSALISLPRNRFYMANFNELNVTVESIIQSWWVANSIEKTSKDDTQLAAANVLKCKFFDIMVKSATIIGGVEHAYKIAPVLASVCYDETLDEYKKGLGI